MRTKYLYFASIILRLFSLYQLSRENAALTREVAAEQLQFISSDRIEKIENERSYTHPDEIPDFIRIKENLEHMSLAIDSLKLWVEHTIASGEIVKTLLEK